MVIDIFKGLQSLRENVTEICSSGALMKRKNSMTIHIGIRPV